MHDAELLFSYPEPLAQALERALAIETGNEVPKTRADITRDRGTLHIRIHAEDLGALRAAVNSYLRWVDAGERSARLGQAST